MSSDPWIPVGSVLTTCPYSDYSFANALHASRSRIGGAWILDTNWNRDFLPVVTRNVETGRPRVILFIYFSLSPTENAREIAGGEGRIREERTVAINEPVKFPASVY